MIDAINSLTTLNETKEKLIQRITTLESTLSTLNSGKKSIKTIFSFKSKEKDIENSTKSKQELEKNLEEITELIRLATYGIDSQIDYFKVEKLANYYHSLKILADLHIANATKSIDLWSLVSNDKNVTKIANNNY